MLSSDPRPRVHEQPGAAHQEEDRGAREEPSFRAVEDNYGDDQDDDAQDGNRHPERAFGSGGHEEPTMVSRPPPLVGATLSVNASFSSGSNDGA